ncbi:MULTISPECIES: hypothetical protein [unclassified Lysobacter]|uniref:hypothetical protein n=1 Tax=unclassified Lysobacter TaxID=2635362 RepID=UPI001BE93D32|nr:MULTISPECIES: hypothetical protein [unclassified Lysobacter]MBT2744909.1 hypothetical protein [Lysobacter sp. ISL-42]MBT2752098.1 hypothetical protein [Lysobacter sp. ISL-50]MBT2778595.1 hypothetical protein [Lysobacter sp. ISL-54]MBT2780474.1 hypothetical protein [Lysobacter sp. ISL-52]
MDYPGCHYSHVSWITQDSSTYQALIKGLENHRTAPAAVKTFVTMLNTANKAFKDGLKPGANLTELLQTYQNTTGIISTRDFTLPDIPPDPGADNSIILDMIEGIVGALSTEIGIGISFYTLIMDFLGLFDIKLHLQGLVFNAADTDLELGHIPFGENGQPSLLPLSLTIPAAKPIMNPLDKKELLLHRLH